MSSYSSVFLGELIPATWKTKYVWKIGGGGEFNSFWLRYDLDDIAEREIMEEHYFFALATLMYGFSPPLLQREDVQNSISRLDLVISGGTNLPTPDIDLNTLRMIKHEDVVALMNLVCSREDWSADEMRREKWRWVWENNDLLQARTTPYLFRSIHPGLMYSTREIVKNMWVSCEGARGRITKRVREATETSAIYTEGDVSYTYTAHSLPVPSTIMLLSWQRPAPTGFIPSTSLEFFDRKRTHSSTQEWWKQNTHIDVDVYNEGVRV
jgi:hypothetical protein